MIKMDLSRGLSEKGCFSIRRSSSLINTTLEIIADALSEGSDVYIKGLGRFTRKKNNYPDARRCYRVVFYPCRTLRDTVK